ETFTGIYHPVRDSMGGGDCGAFPGECWYAIRSPDPPPPTVEAPTGLSATIEAGPRVRLDWTDNSSSELGSRVYQGCMGAPMAYVGSRPADSNVGILWGLVDRYGQSCSYAIRAYIQDGGWGMVESEFSNVATVQIPVGPISGIQPPAGDVGTRVAIIGSGFAPSLDSLTIDGRLANLFFVSGNDGEIQVLMPNAGHSGRVRVTVWKDNSLYGEAAWVQQDAVDYCEPHNDTWSGAAASEPCHTVFLPTDVVGSFAFGDAHDWWKLSLGSPSARLRFKLDWDSAFFDLDLVVARRRLTITGDVVLDLFCDTAGVGSQKPVIFECDVTVGNLGPEMLLHVTAVGGNPVLVSYRLTVTQIP
ncbi:MAG: IPT/TIG domain-containing protein, partial [Gemmatimonadota bacterium]|nr:IPT/TIG domain-containing protein [Gemmatimonadota bacterium]